MRFGRRERFVLAGLTGCTLLGMGLAADAAQIVAPLGTAAQATSGTRLLELVAAGRDAGMSVPVFRFTVQQDRQSDLLALVVPPRSGAALQLGIHRG